MQLKKPVSTTKHCRQRMRRADFRVVLDACVLAPANVCDLLLNLAETPRLYVPIWSEEILAEVRRTQIAKLGFSEQWRTTGRLKCAATFPRRASKASSN